MNTINGNRINEFNLMIVDKSEREVGYKIALNYLEAKIRIRHALATGKSVLFLPGTYDLLHAGHLVWFKEALEKFTSKLNLPKKDIFCVVPFDNDKLTRIEKISKHVSQGGREIYLRPIINERNRAVALANLPYIDLIMPIPSPLDNQDLIPDAGHFNVKHALKLLDNSKESLHLKQTLSKLKKMAQPSRLEAMREAFISYGFLSSQPKDIYQKIGIDTSLWNNDIWQLMCYLYKMDKELFEKYNLPTQNVYRVISEHDGYSSRVKFIMQLAGVKTFSIREDFITSTTDIIKANNTRDKMDEVIASSDPRNYRFS